MNQITPQLAAKLPSSQAASRRLLIAAIAASAIISFLPFTEPITYPIRLFTTIVHEGGHAMATWLTGGSVRYITIDRFANGLTVSAGGILPIIYMAGYIGATAFGAASLLVVRRSGMGRRGLALMAAVVLGITLLWIHPWVSGFGFLAGLGVAALLILGARLLPEAPAQFVAAFLGVQLCLNAVYDLRDLLWMTTHTGAGNDAVFMAQSYPIAPAWFWAILWALCSAAILALCLRAYWRSPRQPRSITQ